MLRFILGVLILMQVTPVAQAAEKRVALIVGNSDYRHAGNLTNPKNDAADVAAALKRLGVHVIDAFDLDKATFDRKVRDFSAALQGAQAGIFFFAGQGLQVAGQNYLMPVDAELNTASALDFEMVRLDVVQRVMENETQTNILLLDACRDNPLVRNLARTMGARSAQLARGLAATESGIGTLISFSTQPGNIALDGTGRNSPYAAALLRQLASPGGDLSAILIAVRTDVVKATLGKQVPWEHSALMGRFYFGPPQSSAVPALALTEPLQLHPRVQAADLFSGQHARRVKSIAANLKLDLPDYRIEVPGPDVPIHLRRFVGVWADESGGGAKKLMMIVTRVEKRSG